MPAADTAALTADGPQFEIRLAFACGHVERWALYREPALEEVEMVNPEPCEPCRAEIYRRYPTVEELVAAQAELRPARRRSRN